MRWESTFTAPFQAFYVDDARCNDFADVGLPDVYADPDLASFNGAVAQRAADDDTNLVKQAVGVFATNDAADRAFRRLVDRTQGAPVRPPRCTSTASSPRSGHSPVIPTGTDVAWVKQEAGTDRRCFIQTRLRENVLLQAKVCQPGNGGPAVNVLAGAMQNALGQ